MKTKLDFILVGAAKSGSTALHQTIGMHPDIYISPLKEPNFFCKDILVQDLRADVKQKLEVDNIEDWIKTGMKEDRWRSYLRDEELYDQLFNQSKSNQKKGEASVSYLYSKVAAEEIYKHNPFTKIVIILRNPVERAFSHYEMEKRMGWTNKSLIELFEEYKENNDVKWGKDLLFLQAGKYAEQVRRYMEVFPTSQIHIIIFDDFRKEPTITLSKLFNFLEVDPAKVNLGAIIKKSNESRTYRVSSINSLKISGGIKVKIRQFLKKIHLHKILKNTLTKSSTSKIGASEKELLKDYYKEDVLKLERLIDRKLNEWK